MFEIFRYILYFVNISTFNTRFTYFPIIKTTDDFNLWTKNQKKNKQTATRKMPFTLRHHKVAVTSLLNWCSEDILPTLISGDEDGTILVWNLLNRKPFYRYKCNGQIISLQQVNDLLVALCKDHTLRIFTFPLSVTLSINNTFSTSHNLAELNLIYEIPVNTLNFANAAVQHINGDIYMLWCCNTQDSETIDVYQFNIQEKTSLRRLHKAIALYEHISKMVDPSVMKFDKLGTVMKFLLYEDRIYIGFESGFVVAVSLSDDLSLHVSYVSSAHYPEPVLDLSVGHDLKMVLSSSTTSSLGLHKAKSKLKHQHDTAEGDIIIDDSEVYSNLIKLPTKKVAHIQQMDNIIVVSTWYGTTEIFDTTGRDTLTIIRKERGQVPVDDNPYGNASLPKDSTRVKISSTICISKTNTNEVSSIKDVTEGIKRRLLRFSNQTWCLVGYEDGSIVVKEIGH